MKAKQFIRKLCRAGVTVVPDRGKGGHIGLTHQGRKTVVPFHGDQDLAPSFLNKVCKQLGLDPRAVL